MIAQVAAHIDRLKERFGSFVHAPHRLQFNPSDPKQVQVLLPDYKGPPLAVIHNFQQTADSIHHKESISGELMIACYFV